MAQPATEGTVTEGLNPLRVVPDLPAADRRAELIAELDRMDAAQFQALKVLNDAVVHEFTRGSRPCLGGTNDWMGYVGLPQFLRNGSAEQLDTVELKPPRQDMLRPEWLTDDGLEALVTARREEIARYNVNIRRRIRYAVTNHWVTAARARQIVTDMGWEAQAVGPYSGGKVTATVTWSDTSVQGIDRVRIETEIRRLMEQFAQGKERPHITVRATRLKNEDLTGI